MFEHISVECWQRSIFSGAGQTCQEYFASEIIHCRTRLENTVRRIHFSKKYSLEKYILEKGKYVRNILPLKLFTAGTVLQKYSFCTRACMRACVCVCLLSVVCV